MSDTTLFFLIQIKKDLGCIEYAATCNLDEFEVPTSCANYVAFWIQYCMWKLPFPSGVLQYLNHDVHLFKRAKDILILRLLIVRDQVTKGAATVLVIVKLQINAIG